MIDIKYMIERISDSKIEKELIYSKDTFRNFIKIFNKYMEENTKEKSKEVNNENTIEFVKNISEYFKGLVEEAKEIIMNAPEYREESIRLNTNEYLENHPEEIERLYEEISEEEVEANKGYTFNIEESKREAVRETIEECREIQIEIGRIMEEYSSSSEEEKKQKLRNPKQLEILNQAIKFTDMSDVEQVKELYKGKSREIKSKLKTELITTLTQIGTFLTKVGAIEEYLEIQKRVFENVVINIPELEFHMEDTTEDDKKGELCVKNIFSEEKLNKLDINQLYALNAFWLNRFTKTVENINSTYVTVDSLNLWKKLIEEKNKKGNIKLDIDSENLKGIYIKCEFMKRLKAKLEEIEEKRPKSLGPEKETEKSESIEQKEELMELQSDQGEIYNEIFQRYIPGMKHDLIKDSVIFKPLNDMKYNSYLKKDQCILGLIETLSRDKFSLNYGIMLEKEQKKSPIILIGMDIHGFNMPLRLHANKKLIVESLKEKQGNALFPIYEGREDYQIAGRKIGTHILGPVSVEYRKKLKSILEKQKINPRLNLENFIEHLIFIGNSKKYPNHLKEEGYIKEKGKRVKTLVRPPRRYIDLETGEVYIQQKDASIVKKNQENQENQENIEIEGGEYGK